MSYHWWIGVLIFGLGYTLGRLEALFDQMRELKRSRAAESRLIIHKG
jgi:hypothetical protein